MKPTRVIARRAPSAIARCLPDCNAPLVLILGERTVMVRCTCNRLVELRPVTREPGWWWDREPEDL